MVEAVLLLVALARPTVDVGQTVMKTLAEQVLNSAIIAAIPVVPTLLLSNLDWRVPVVSFLSVFLAKLAIARGLKGVGE